ncbi:MAG: hypothetical protein AAF735_00295 [Myxococcota bacterium]
MAEIRDSGIREAVQDQARSYRNADQQLQDILRDMQQNRSRSVALAQVEVEALSEAGKAALQRAVAQQLKGQLPPNLAKALADGKLDANLLGRLTQRVANANDPNATNRTPKAESPEAARNMAKDGQMPEHALRWTQFVQRIQHIPGAQVHGRSGTAGVKGEGTTLIEMLSQSLGANGAGLRAPGLAALAVRDLGVLSPGQRALLLDATFGPELAAKLQSLGVEDPLQLVRAGALPEGRAELSTALNMPRGRLLAFLMRAELLKIGPGTNGELGMRPEFLAPLKDAGVAMLGTLAALRMVSHEELNHIYQQLRMGLGGYALNPKGGRPVLKRDLLHWARVAARRPSDIMLLDREHAGQSIENEDAQEIISAWYLENLFWEELAQRRDKENRRVERDDRERRDQQRQDDERREREDDEDRAYRDDLPELAADDARSDEMMCFWISDYNTTGHMAGILRRMYVCIDPETGGIIPQQLESEHVDMSSV